MALTHGGNRIRASAEFGIAPEAWIDLSTGISPWSWPVPPLPEAVWQRLPEEGDELLPCAARYYGCPPHHLMALPGSQYAISRVPGLLPPAAVALPHWGYREHHRAWREAGHLPRMYRDAAGLQRLVENGTVTHALVINPNNPGGDLLAPDFLEALAGGLARRAGLLLVDEAFMDPLPHHSLIPRRPANALVLRSLGKFFGLAGVRLGFMVAAPEWLTRLAERLDPWAVSHPARWIGRLALGDRNWQQIQRRRLLSDSSVWLSQLQALFPGLPWRGTALFASAATSKAAVMYRAAARRGLLLRLHDDQDPPLIRLGLPADGERFRTLSILDIVGKHL